MRPPVLDRLRRGTADIHARLDEGLPLASPRIDVATYLSVLARFHAIQTAADAALQPHAADLHAFGYDVTSRHEVTWLDEDFAWWNAQGMDVAREPSVALPALVTTADAFGWVYVLEGSTLGGQVILRNVSRALQLEPPHGCRYFYSHGASTGPRWRTTCDSLHTFAACASEERSQDMVRSARALFTTIDMIFNQASV